MTKAEMTKAVELAKTRKVSVPTDLTVFDGFGFRDYKPVYVTLDAVAALVNWQALQFNGTYDPEAINEIAIVGRKKFQIIG